MALTRHGAPVPCGTRKGTGVLAGIGVLPHFIARQMPGLDRVLASTVDIRRTFWLVVHRDARQLARVDAFINWLVDLAAREPLLRAG